MYGELFKGGTLSVAKLVEERGPLYIKIFQHFKDIKINNTENEIPKISCQCFLQADMTEALSRPLV